MTKCSQGDVVLIPFPFTDLTTFKQRPALILSSLLGSSDLERAGLPKKSLVKLGKIVTIDQRLVRKKLGSLPPPTFSKILTGLQPIFGYK